MQTIETLKARRYDFLTSLSACKSSAEGDSVRQCSCCFGYGNTSQPDMSALPGVDIIYFRRIMLLSGFQVLNLFVLVLRYCIWVERVEFHLQHAVPVKQ